MWIIKWILSIVIILILLLIAFQNQEQTVSVKIGLWQTEVLPLYIFLYISFALGILFWLIISVFKILGFKRQIYKINKENRKIKEELDRLRNVSIDEDVAVEPNDHSESPESTEI